MLKRDEMLARLGEAVGALDQPSIDGINLILFPGAPASGPEGSAFRFGW